MDFSQRGILENNVKYAFNDVEVTELAKPVGSQTIETTSQAIARMLLSSGAVTRDQYEAMIGLHFDTLGEEDSEDFTDERFATTDDNFVQSSFASYEPEPSSASSESPGVVETPKITSSDVVVAKSDVPASADSGSPQEQAEPDAQ